MDDEIWRDVRGYEGLYAVSNMGRVKSLYDGRHKIFREKIISSGKSMCGYLSVGLVKEGKRKWYRVHRLVLMAFNPCPDSESLQVNHINEKKDDNRLENLEWCTTLYNLTYNDRHKKIGEKQSIPIVQLALDGKYIRSWKSSYDAEREGGGFNHSSIIACCKGKLKSHKGYRFMYLSEYMDKHNGLLID